MADNSVAPGARTYLDLRELGAQGFAKVIAIEACPDIEEGEGRVVTSTYKYLRSNDIYELQVSEQSESIFVTKNHPFWVENKQTWLPVKDLLPGDTLRTAEGSVTVQSLTKTSRQEPVYNIEVEGDHVYRVGTLGILVHNNSQNALPNGVDPSLTAPSSGVVYKRIDKTGKVKPYIGQAKSDERYVARQSEHARAHPDSDFEFEEIGRAEPGVGLDVLEHNNIQKLTDGVAARKSTKVSNMKCPVGKARRKKLGLPEPRRKE